MCKKAALWYDGCFSSYMNVQPQHRDTERYMLCVIAEIVPPFGRIALCLSFARRLPLGAAGRWFSGREDFPVNCLCIFDPQNGGRLQSIIALLRLRTWPDGPQGMHAHMSIKGCSKGLVASQLENLKIKLTGTQGLPLPRHRRGVRYA